MLHWRVVAVLYFSLFYLSDIIMLYSSLFYWNVIVVLYFCALLKGCSSVILLFVLLKCCSSVLFFFVWLLCCNHQYYSFWECKIIYELFHLMRISNICLYKNNLCLTKSRKVSQYLNGEYDCWYIQLRNILLTQI